MANVQALNGKLTAQPYVSGFVPSKDDATTFKEMFGGNTAAIQWAARMASYYQSERATILDPSAKPAEKKEEKKVEAKHVDPTEEEKNLPVAAAAPLIANFKKFAGDKSAYFMTVSLEYINDVAAFIAGPEGFSAAEILVNLTDCKNCAPLCDAYIKIAKTSEKKQEKVRAELTKLVEDFVDPKVGGVKKLDAKAAQKKKVEVPAETAELIAEFAKFVADKQTYKQTTAKGLAAVLEYLPEGFHPADIKSMLTNGEDCDELLESYVRIAVVPSADKLRARNELVSFVEAFAESKGITHDEMCF